MLNRVSAEIGGRVDAGFEGIRDAFAANFAREDPYREQGAAVVAYQDGREVANLWGGYASGGTERLWTADTLVNVWSATKGATACAIAMLVDQQRLAWQTKIGSLWPEFSVAGKAEVTLAQVMSHQAGLPGFAEPTTIDDQFDWDACCAKLARQAPAWIPGDATSYHAMTFGWLAGEIVRRVTGLSIGAFVREKIARPLAADIHIGLPIALEPRVAEIAGPRQPPAGAAPSPVALMAVTNPVQDPEAPNRREWRAAEIPAANGQASAQGLARLYAGMLPEGLDGVRLLSEEGLAGLVESATSNGRTDLLMGFTDGWGRGVMLNPGGIYGPGPRAFGHSGWGGSFGCADPDLKLGVGYVCNQMGSEATFDPRAVALSDAIVRCGARR